LDLRQRGERRARRAPKNRNGMWRAAAFRAQIERTLNQCFEAEIADPRLDAVVGFEVEANPNGSSLLVLVRTHPGAGVEDTCEVVEAIHAVEGLFRSRVAAAIHRKRTPPLTFVVLGPAERLADVGEEES